MFDLLSRGKCGSFNSVISEHMLRTKFIKLIHFDSEC